MRVMACWSLCATPDHRPSSIGCPHAHFLLGLRDSGVTSCLRRHAERQPPYCRYHGSGRQTKASGISAAPICGRSSRRSELRGAIRGERGVVPSAKSRRQSRLHIDARRGQAAAASRRSRPTASAQRHSAMAIFRSRLNRPANRDPRCGHSSVQGGSARWRGWSDEHPGPIAHSLRTLYPLGAPSIGPVVVFIPLLFQVGPFLGPIFFCTTFFPESLFLDAGPCGDRVPILGCEFF